MKVTIEEYYDGFAIVVYNGEKEERFDFNQEDSKKGLKKVFKALGIESQYKEIS